MNPDQIEVFWEIFARRARRESQQADAFTALRVMCA
jgi:hypothetical protein